MVGIVVVSHSSDLAQGSPSSPAQSPGPRCASSPPAACRRRARHRRGPRARAIRRADPGDGVVVLGDLGSAILTVRHVLERGNGHVQLADAPLVEGAVAAAVVASAGMPLEDVARAAEEARGAGKL